MIPVAELRGKGETVLVLDDDASLRQLARRILEQSGYSVREAATGEEAVSVARATPALALLISDVVMPGVPAAEVCYSILMLRPDAKVLFTSGYSAADLVATQLLTARTKVLQKPFTASSFLAAVRAALDESPSLDMMEHVG